MTISGFTAYVKQLWKNKPDTSTPLSADRLLHIEDGIKGNSDAIAKIAAAVVNQITNDPDKIASMAALYAVNQSVTKLNSDLDDRDAVADLQAVADAGLNTRRIVRCNSDTLNTPYKAGITGAGYGTAYIGMISVNSGTIFYVCDSFPRAFLRAKDGGTWGDWVSIAMHNEVQHGTITLDAAIPANSSKSINITFPTKFQSTPDIAANLIINSSSMDINKVSVHIGSRTINGCTIIIQNGGSIQSKPAVGWTAVGT